MVGTLIGQNYNNVTFLLFAELQGLELNVKEQALLHLTETPLFNPETCAYVVCAGIFNALNSCSEMNILSDPESIRARAV